MSSKRLPNGQTHIIGQIPDVDNEAIVNAFMRLCDAPETRKTHLFGGRYENIYIARDLIPELELVFNVLEQRVLDITGCDPEKLKLGFWMNAMEPGHQTTLHSHDDWDEVVSAVYYVTVPDKSGYLVLVNGAERVAVSPRAGRYVMFSPAMPHEVTVNKSDAMRLSVGINIGVEEN